MGVSVSRSDEVDTERLPASAARSKWFWRRPDLLAAVLIVVVLGSLLVPAVRKARYQARAVAMRCHGLGIASAVHIYQDVHKQYPSAAIYNRRQQPILSWRVEILPFLESNELTKRFDREEPWSGVANKPLLTEMPEPYRNLLFPSPTHTTSVVPTGAHTMFVGNRGMPPEEVKDGASRTIFMIEIDGPRAVPWTAPRELNFDARNPKRGLGTERGWFHTFLADGSARPCTNDIDPEVLRRLIDPADGMPIDTYDFDMAALR